MDQCLTKSEWTPQIRTFYLRQNHEEPWWWTLSLSLSLSNRDLLPNASGSSPLLKSLWNLSLPKVFYAFCMLVVNPLAVEITFSLIELQKVGVQQSLKVVNHITFSFINSLESFVETGVLFPWSNFSNSIVESWSTSISKWGNQIRKSVSHTFQVNKWCWNHILFVRDPFHPYDERLAELQSSGEYVCRS